MWVSPNLLLDTIGVVGAMVRGEKEERPLTMNDAHPYVGQGSGDENLNPRL